MTAPIRRGLAYAADRQEALATLIHGRLRWSLMILDSLSLVVHMRTENMPSRTVASCRISSGMMHRCGFGDRQTGRKYLDEWHIWFHVVFVNSCQACSFFSSLTHTGYERHRPRIEVTSCSDCLSHVQSLARTGFLMLLCGCPPKPLPMAWQSHEALYASHWCCYFAPSLFTRPSPPARFGIFYPP